MKRRSRLVLRSESFSRKSVYVIIGRKTIVSIPNPIRPQKESNAVLAIFPPGPANAGSDITTKEVIITIAKEIEFLFISIQMGIRYFGGPAFL